MRYIGAHVSASGGVENAPLNAAKISANAFALFTKNQRQWKAPDLTRSHIVDFKKNMQKHGFDPDYVLPHDSYLINLGSPDKNKLNRSRQAFLDEMKRCEQLDLRCLNFHPGSSLYKISDEQCLDLITESINITLKNSEKVTAVIENTAGQGSNLGYKFEHLAYIIQRIDDKNRIGVCLDTCHLFAAGYDLRTNKSFNKTFKEFDRIVGFEYLKGMHLNDSKKKLANKVDRHASLGEGFIGLKPFKMLIRSEFSCSIPLILETPDPKKWEAEIRLLRSFE